MNVKMKSLGGNSSPCSNAAHAHEILCGYSGESVIFTYAPHCTDCEHSPFQEINFRGRGHHDSEPTTHAAS